MAGRTRPATRAGAVLVLATATVAALAATTAPVTAAPGAEAARAASAAAAAVPVPGPVSGLVRAGRHAYFVAPVAGHASSGSQLWRTDGTAAGTRLVTRPARHRADFEGGHLTAVGNRVFLIGRTREHGRELWRSDGTAAGTRLVRDLVPGSRGLSDLSSFTGSAHTLFFLRGGDHPRLWRSDGSWRGTFAVRSRKPLPTSFGELLGWHDGLLFTASGRGKGRELWKSDGRTLWLLKDIRPNDEEHVLPSRAAELTAGDSVAYFRANDGAYRWNNTGIWRTDGTAAGTRYVLNVDPLRELWDVTPLPEELGTSGDRLYFLDQDCTHGWEPWTSDGTAEGTQVLDLQPGTGECGAGSRPLGMVTGGPGGLAYVSARTQSAEDPAVWRSGLWELDGETGSARLVTVLPEYYDHVANGATKAVTTTHVFLMVNETLSRGELWVSDGTQAGTRSLRMLRSDDFEMRVALGDRLLFEADGERLWVSDGTPAGTHALVAG